ncbi:hypothetical protein B0A77_12245 [Flavobacterium branchiophilum]|uniref:Uncharacterized protein n=1 Tax=Flavobacterium branchiophilum TaxID=55197 RepID=A0A2H3KT26_9FLAO|nr:hypothetical protein B0A77_12245 [Flavobacterium branchiophilum]
MISDVCQTSFSLAIFSKDPIYFGFDSIKNPLNAIANALISALELGFSLGVFKINILLKTVRH